jgi:hypothetical protein
MLTRAHTSIHPLDGDLDATLHAFTGEAASYCEGISDHIASQYAVSFTLMLENRAREVAVEETQVSHIAYDVSEGSLGRLTLTV